MVEGHLIRAREDNGRPLFFYLASLALNITCDLLSKEKVTHFE